MKRLAKTGARLAAVAPAGLPQGALEQTPEPLVDGPQERTKRVLGRDGDELRERATRPDAKRRVQIGAKRLRRRLKRGARVRRPRAAARELRHHPERPPAQKRVAGCRIRTAVRAAVPPSRFEIRREDGGEKRARGERRRAAPLAAAASASGRGPPSTPPRASPLPVLPPRRVVRALRGLRRREAPLDGAASATSAFAPKRSQSSSRSMTHTALGLAASSSSSATYCSGSSVQVSSCAPVMHMYPTHVCTISPSPGSRFAPSRGCSASVISSSSS